VYVHECPQEKETAGHDPSHFVVPFVTRATYNLCTSARILNPTFPHATVILHRAAQFSTITLKKMKLAIVLAVLLSSVVVDAEKVS
jgi:hypothetical protein